MDTISGTDTTDGWAPGEPGTFTPPPPPEPPAPPVEPPAPPAEASAPPAEASAPPTGPRHRARPAPPRLAVIAAGAAVAIFAAGYFLGSASKNGAPSAPATPEAAGNTAPAASAGAWSFHPAPADAVCAKGGSKRVFDSLNVGTDGPAPGRLSDYMLTSSPVGDYEAAYDGPVELTTQPATTPHAIFARFGARNSYARTFNSPSHPGGFSNYAFEFPDKRAAVSAATDAYVGLVCNKGADPVTVRHHPGIVVGVPVGTARDTVAWWIQGRRLLEVDYAMYGSRAADLANAAIVLHASWMRTGGHPAAGSSS